MMLGHDVDIYQTCQPAEEEWEGEKGLIRGEENGESEEKGNGQKWLTLKNSCSLFGADTEMGSIFLGGLPFFKRTPGRAGWWPFWPLNSKAASIGR